MQARGQLVKQLVALGARALYTLGVCARIRVASKGRARNTCNGIVRIVVRHVRNGHALRANKINKRLDAWRSALTHVSRCTEKRAGAGAGAQCSAVQCSAVCV